LGSTAKLFSENVMLGEMPSDNRTYRLFRLAVGPGDRAGIGFSLRHQRAAEILAEDGTGCIGRRFGGRCSRGKKVGVASRQFGLP
jgi:hypothetical protein